MSESELPDGRVEEIVFRALESYSDGCEAPELTPECPFSVDVEPGLRACGEECRIILNGYPGYSPSGEIAIGGEIGVRGTRPTRDRSIRTSGSIKPFDSREIWLSEKETLPVEQWNLVSLLHGLLDELSVPPTDDLVAVLERRARIDRLVYCIEELGLDFDLHVMHAVRPRMPSFALEKLFTSEDDFLDRHSVLKSWRALGADLAEHSDASSVDARGEEIAAILKPLFIWSLTGSFNDICSWEPPEQLVLDQSSLKTLPVPDEVGQWMTDRFLETYLKDWSTTSLHHEWSYMHSAGLSPVNEEEMSVRYVRQEELDRHIAARAVDGATTGKKLTDHLVKPAVAFIEDGQPAKAATLFEAVTLEEPDDPAAFNNLGFCLIPDQPERALVALERSLILPACDTLLNSINRAVCLGRLGRYTSAIDLASSALETIDNNENFFSWLWDVQDLLANNSAALVTCDDPAQYLTDLLGALKEMTAA
ncbi:MAG: hypothetical protein OXH58_05555 [Acidimicrobiaceae bacterium]|nr:hypothetical protein [Acidimicrobiaceae bacterium]